MYTCHMRTLANTRTHTHAHQYTHPCSSTRVSPSLKHWQPAAPAVERSEYWGATSEQETGWRHVS
eukprot:3307212-Alexandrium_andersonii.AAC.1